MHIHWRQNVTCIIRQQDHNPHTQTSIGLEATYVRTWQQDHTHTHTGQKAMYVMTWQQDINPHTNINGAEASYVRTWQQDHNTHKHPKGRRQHTSWPGNKTTNSVDNTSFISRRPDKQINGELRGKGKGSHERTLRLQHIAMPSV